VQIENYFLKRIENLRHLVNSQNTFPIVQLEVLVREIEECFQSGGKIAFVGNGGSAAEAMHIAAEFTGKCIKDHKPWPALCLNESQSSLTAIANDYGVANMFSRMVEAHLKPKDILICLSTSGKSQNILNAIVSAKRLDVNVYLWMGDYPGPALGVKEMKVPSKSTPQIQEIHLMWGHLIAEYLEQDISID
jgi:D-sedoheptulose 7-phosphate isomerase